MLNNRNFWLAQMIVLLALYAAAIVLGLQGHGIEHIVVRIAVIVLAAHVLEVPIAFYMLKSCNPQPLRLIVATLLFGLVWWLPARRGLMAVA